MATTETIPTVEPESSEVSDAHHTKKGLAKLLPWKNRAKEKATSEPQEPGPGQHEQQTDEPVQHGRSHAVPLKKWRWPSIKTSEPPAAPSAAASREVPQASDVDVASRQDTPATDKKKEGRRNSKKLVKTKSNKQKAAETEAEAEVPTSDVQSPPPAAKPSSSGPNSPIARLVASIKKHPSEHQEHPSDILHESSTEADQEIESASPEPPAVPEKSHKLFSGKLSRSLKMKPKTTAPTALASVEEDAPAGYRCPACGHCEPANSPRPKVSQRPSSGPAHKESLFKRPRRGSGSGSRDLESGAGRLGKA